MRRFRQAVMLIAVLCAGFVFVSTVSAYELTDSVKLLPPKEELPKDMSAELRAQVEKLYEENVLTRSKAISEIHNMGEEALPAMPILLIVLKDENWILRKKVITYFSYFADEKVIDTLQEVHDGEINPPVKRAARLAIAEIKKRLKLAP
jgi:HEAT repeat protein